MDSTYTKGLKALFFSLQRERDDLDRYLYEAQMIFKELLVGSDQKQEILNAFQTDFNAVMDELRYKGCLKFLFILQI